MDLSTDTVVLTPFPEKELNNAALPKAVESYEEWVHWKLKLEWEQAGLLTVDNARPYV